MPTLATHDGHALAYGLHGAAGAPWTLVLHGGPGSGCGPHLLQRFDLTRHRVVLLDQRGAGASRPYAADASCDLAAMTTDHHLRDVEQLRGELGVERWLVHGTSWGATLATAYVVAQPDRVRAAVLAPVTLTRPSDVGAFTDGAPFALDDLARRLRDDPDDQDAADRWCAWEDALAARESGGGPDPRFVGDARFRRAFARQVTHAFAHHAWRGEDELLAGMRALDAPPPAALVHGTADVGTPPQVAQELHAAWRGSTLELLPGTGHGGRALTQAIRRATNALADAR